MAVRRHANLRVWAPILIGAAIVGSLFVPAGIGGEEEGARSGTFGALLLLSPYLLFALIGHAARPVAWSAFLAALVAGSLFGLTAAGSSSTGALVFLWLLPAQWGLSAVAALTALTGSR